MSHSRRRLRSPLFVPLFVPLVVSLFACPPPRPGADGGPEPTPDAGGPDASLPDAGGYPGDPEITIEMADAGAGIAGRFQTVEFLLEQGASPDLRIATFRDSAADAGVTVTIDDAQRTQVFTAGALTWNGGDTLTPEGLATVQALTRSTVGKALLRVSADLYWKTPGIDLMRFRMAAIQLYGGLASSYDAADKALSQPPDSVLPGCPDNPCQLRSNDALFGCVYPNGDAFDVVPLLDGLPRQCQVVGAEELRGHENECYGACGLACVGCKLVDYQCTDGSIGWGSGGVCADLTTGSSAPVGCFTTPAEAFYPRYDLSVDPSACAAAQTYRGGSYYICSSAPGCYTHDECTEHDGFGSANFVKCNLMGADVEGVAAAWGRPAAPWEYKFFNSSRHPISLGTVASLTDQALGTCTWEGRGSGAACSAFPVTLVDSPAEVPHEPDEHALCLVHQCKHQGAESFCRCAVDSDCPVDGVETPPEKVCTNGRCVVGVHIQVSPATTTLDKGNQAQFTVNPPVPVTWSATAGSIGRSGVFTAPQVAGTPVVTATVIGIPGAKATAQVTVNDQWGSEWINGPAAPKFGDAGGWAGEFHTVGGTRSGTFDLIAYATYPDQTVDVGISFSWTGYYQATAHVTLGASGSASGPRTDGFTGTLSFNIGMDGHLTGQITSDTEVWAFTSSN